MSDTVKFGYSSSKKITFNGVIHTDITRDEWDEMSESAKDEVIEEMLFDLVQVWVVEE
jgi:hypothetical protein